MPNTNMQPGPPQKVTLVPTGNGPNIQWKVKLNDGPDENPATAKTNLGDGVGPTKFTVNIAGNPAIKFKSQDPMWVWEGSKSAPQPGGHPQILGPVLTDKGELVFFDLNMGGKASLNYQLNFEGSVPPVDPIIENGGGGQPPPPPPPVGGGYGFMDVGSSAFWLFLGAIFLTCLAANLVAGMIKTGK